MGRRKKYAEGLHMMDRREMIDELIRMNERMKNMSAEIDYLRDRYMNPEDFE